jgi:two-component system OmpR family sensor kinase
VNRARTLTARLVVTAVGLLAVTSILVALATTLAMRTYLNDQLDDDVLASIGRAEGPGPGGPGRPDDGATIAIGNQPPGTLWSLPDQGLAVVLGNRRDDNDELSGDAVAALNEVPVDGHVHTVEGDFGRYRVTAVNSDQGLFVIGLPSADFDEAVLSLIAAEAAFVLLGIAAAAAAGTFVVRRQLAPLREVAATAHAVAELPLSEGAIDMTARVPERLTDERNEVGQVGSALNTLLDHVETSLAARHRSEQQVRQFVADASHELRTPLATIAGYTELARRQPAATATALDKVESESARMTSLVEDLLLLARLDSGRPLADEPVDLTKLLLEAVGDARVLGQDHTWRLALPDEPVEVRGDEQRLHQVVTNLLTNARKHTPPGTTVTVTASTDGFVVHDDGPGFPAGLLDHAFERFVRADEARTRAGGAGLGLALVDAIISAHGGRVTLASLPGDTAIAVRL